MTIYENLIRRYLDDEGIRYADIWDTSYSDRVEVTVYIEHRDKHDHLEMVRSVSRFNPVEHLETVTDEDGSDCYSAEHTFVFTEEWSMTEIINLEDGIMVHIKLKSN